MQNHISNMCRSSSYALHMIGQVRKYLDQATTEKLVHAFVMSRLDNCNSLLYGLPVSLLSIMQSIQNAAARIVSRKRLHDHISPILNELHWLPVEKRITFKLLILAYKFNQGVAPQYLLDIVKSYQPARNLRSSSILLIFLHRTLLLQKDMGNGLFSMQFLSCGTHYQIT